MEVRGWIERGFIWIPCRNNMLLRISWAFEAAGEGNPNGVNKRVQGHHVPRAPYD